MSLFKRHDALRAISLSTVAELKTADRRKRGRRASPVKPAIRRSRKPLDPIAQAIADGEAEERRRQLECPPGYLLRADFLRATGITSNQLKRFEEAGVVQSSGTSPSGKPLYRHTDATAFLIANPHHAPESTIALALRDHATKTAGYSREDAQRVFALLRKGASPIECVIEAGVSPPDVRALVAEWKNMAGQTFTLTRENLEEVQELTPSDRPIRTFEGLKRALMEIVQDVYCTECRRRVHCGLCSICVDERARDEQLDAEHARKTLEAMSPQLSLFSASGSREDAP